MHKLGVYGRLKYNVTQVISTEGNNFYSIALPEVMRLDNWMKD